MTHSTLAAKYRPRRFRDIAGQPDKTLLWHMVKEGADVPPVMLFCGPSGVGKTTAARLFAAGLNCENVQEGEPCGECPSCVAAFKQNHPGIIETDGSRYSSADAMRALLNDALVSHGSKITTFIIDEVQGLSSQAWNVMLKVFEEPPPGVLFILLTSEVMKVKPAIRNRAMRLDFGQVSPAEVKKRLDYVIEAEGITIAPDDVELVLDLCDGSVREAIKLVEQISRNPEGGASLLADRDKSFEILHAAVRNDRVEGLRLLTETYRKTGNAQGIVEQLALAMEKILMVKYDIPTYLSPSKVRYIRELSATLDDNLWAAAMEVLADWVMHAKSASHLIFVYTAMTKALHGPAKPVAAQTTQRPQQQLVEEDEAVNLLQGMSFD